MPKSPPSLPLAARRALAKAGADIAAARRRRRLPLGIVADRALTTRQTIARIERGDPSVAVGTWATVLFVLGLIDRLVDIAAPAADEVGLALEAERLPKRVHLISRLRGRTGLVEGDHGEGA
jgi:predicted transcriptional regulator